MTTTVIVAVVERNLAYLLCQQPNREPRGGTWGKFLRGKPKGGLWEFPRSKLLDGENSLEASKRIVREQLGVEWVHTSGSDTTVTDSNSNRRILYYSIVVEGEPQALKHERLAWVRADSILKYKMAPEDRVYAGRLGVWVSTDSDLTG